METHQYTGGDQQAPNSNSVYGDFLMESLLGMLLPKVEETTGLALSPTYSYYRVYKAGEELKEHCDRPACEVSLSLCLGYDYLGKNFRWRFAIGDKKMRSNRAMPSYIGAWSYHTQGRSFKHPRGPGMRRRFYITWKVKDLTQNSNLTAGQAFFTGNRKIASGPACPLIGLQIMIKRWMIALGP